MHPSQRTLLWINVAGGVAVLGSYAVGIATHPEPGLVWGGVPAWLKPAYTMSMLSAAVGYFPFTVLFALGVDPDRTQIGGLWRFGLVNLLYAIILLPSALWMPLTFAMLDRPSPGLWIAIRVVLGLVGLGSTGLLMTLVALRPRPPVTLHVLALAGALAFWLQTAVLDALVWPAYFP